MDYDHIYHSVLLHHVRRGGLPALDVPGREAASMEGNVDNNVETVDNRTEGAQNAQTVDYEALYREASQSVADLTAERDSLLTENKDLRAAKDAAIADGAKAREMNYTLSRQLNLGQQAQKQPEDILAGMFLKPEGR